MGGRKIADRGSWVSSNGSILPMGTKQREESTSEHAGGLDMYEDTTESIKRQQDMGAKKIKGSPQKAGYRN